MIFIDDFTQAIEAVLGKNWSSMSNPEVLQETGLPISDETLRKIRAGGYEPSLQKQAEIFDQLKFLTDDAGMLYTHSEITRGEVLSLLGIGATETLLANQEMILPCDLVLEDRGLGLGRYIIRCLDDSQGELAVRPRYYSELIST